MNTVNNYQDVIDVRDIINRVEYLEADQPLADDRELAELDELKKLLDELAGNGGDEKWQGEWYPLSLIRDSYFTEYAEELACEMDLLPVNEWPHRWIDWDKAAGELQMDYTSVVFGGITYWYR